MDVSACRSTSRCSTPRLDRKIEDDRPTPPPPMIRTGTSMSVMTAPFRYSEGSRAGDRRQAAGSAGITWAAEDQRRCESGGYEAVTHGADVADSGDQLIRCRDHAARITGPA